MKSNIEDPKTYFFQATERINGYLYIMDDKGNLVGLHGKKLKFKTITKCAEMVYKLEFARNKSLEV